MRLLELFAGSRSVGKVAETMGFEVFSVDVNGFENIDLVKDIEQITLADVPWTPDVIWASPPCTTYSIAAISTHRDGTTPKTEAARKADKLLAKTLEIMTWFPGAKFFIENPVGMMRKMPQLRSIERRTVIYCSYLDTRMKPTDIFTNAAATLFRPDGWQPKPKCRNGEIRCHHEPAPRGSRTGTQGLANAYERGRIPEELIKEILASIRPQEVERGTNRVDGKSVV